MRTSVWPSLTSVASGAADLCPPLAPAPPHCKTPYPHAFHKATYFRLLCIIFLNFSFKHSVFTLHEMVPAFFPHRTQPWPLCRSPYSLLFTYCSLAADPKQTASSYPERSLSKTEYPLLRRLPCRQISRPLSSLSNPVTPAASPTIQQSRNLLTCKLQAALKYTCISRRTFLL